MKWRLFIPFIIFIGLGIFLWRGLSLDPSEIPSALLNKPVPTFSLPNLKLNDDVDGVDEVVFSNDDLKGHVSIVNVWATWCASCQIEHPVLMNIARQAKGEKGFKGLVVFGLNYKDNRDDALRWLQQLGDPYTKVGFDGDGRAAIDWGVYGTPETFVIDREGVIRYRQVGPVTQEVWEKTLAPLVEKLRRMS